MATRASAKANRLRKRIGRPVKCCPFCWNLGGTELFQYGVRTYLAHDTCVLIWNEARRRIWAGEVTVSTSGLHTYLSKFALTFFENIRRTEPEALMGEHSDYRKFTD